MSSDVVVLAWPAQADEAERLRGLRTPRLLLVRDGAEPPRDADDLVDWVRVPADEKEVAARVVALIRRAAHGGGTSVHRPHIDNHGRCVYGDRWTALSPTEARLATVLCNRYMEVVSDAELLAGLRAQDHGVEPPNAGALRVHLTRLRHRVASLGLEVVNVRRQGVVLQRATS